MVGDPLQLGQEALGQEAADVLLLLGLVEQLEVLLLVVVQHVLGLSVLLELVEIDLLCFVRLLFVLVGGFGLAVGQYLFAVVGDGAIAAVDPFLEAVVEASLPDIDDLVRPTRDEVISLPAELGGVGVRLQSVLQSPLLAVPDLGGSVFGGGDEVGAVRMEVDALDWPLVPLVDLYDMLRAQVVELDLLVVRAGGDAVAEGVELDLVDDSRVLLVGLDGLLGVEIPDVDELVVAGD